MPFSSGHYRVHWNLNSARNPQMRIQQQQRENSITIKNITVIMNMVMKVITPTAWRGTGIIITIITITTTASNRLMWVSRSWPRLTLVRQPLSHQSWNGLELSTLGEKFSTADSRGQTLQPPADADTDDSSLVTATGMWQASDTVRGLFQPPDADRAWRRTTTSGRPDSDVPSHKLNESCRKKPEPDQQGMWVEYDRRSKQGRWLCNNLVWSFIASRKHQWTPHCWPTLSVNLTN